jgi:translation initiation factor 6 (eIF-6)
MPAKSNRRAKHNNKGNAFRTAPKQGISDHASFVMNDLSVATIPGTANPGTYVLRVSCDVNGWSWVVSQNTAQGVNTINALPAD